ncbi:hypothetical protein AB0O51_20240 [Streptomyces sp. NPDC090301]|uniref:aspartate-alanine antiporter-like transporter n=1 Tax=Streptomyces sp. NPDC090301 TaxID=3154975 RepID=UPI003434B19E
MVRFGPVKLGPAGVLFVGLLLGALDPDIGPAVPAGLSVLGLALYVYTVGLEAGPAFFRELRPQLAVMTGAVAALVVTAVAVGLLGSKVFGIDGPYLAGGFAGIGTTTPGLAAARPPRPTPPSPPPATRSATPSPSSSPSSSSRPSPPPATGPAAATPAPDSPRN